MIEFLYDKWVFAAGLVIAFGAILKLMNSEPKMDKKLENEYKKLITSDKYKVK